MKIDLFYERKPANVLLLADKSPRGNKAREIAILQMGKTGRGRNPSETGNPTGILAGYRGLICSKADVAIVQSQLLLLTSDDDEIVNEARSPNRLDMFARLVDRRIVSSHRVKCSE